MRRTTLVTIGAAVLLATWAAPANAHSTFAQAGVPANSDQRLTLNVSEERGPDVHNVGVDAQVPSGWSALGCEALPSWQCQVAGGVIRWTRNAGAGPSDADQAFAFTVRTGAPGTAAMKVKQTYDTGEVVLWFGPASAEEPAAFIEVLAPGSPPPTTTAPTTAPPTTSGITPTTKSTATTSRPPAVTTTLAPATTTTTVTPG
ncbi:MAG: hypothetical protein ABIS21_01155, partial [Acidimicrobiales bacterium]